MVGPKTDTSQCLRLKWLWPWPNMSHGDFCDKGCDNFCLAGEPGTWAGVS